MQKVIHDTCKSQVPLKLTYKNPSKEFSVKTSTHGSTCRKYWWYPQAPLLLTLNVGIEATESHVVLFITGHVHYRVCSERQNCTWSPTHLQFVTQNCTWSPTHLQFVTHNCTWSQTHLQFVTHNCTWSQTHLQFVTQNSTWSQTHLQFVTQNSAWSQTHLKFVTSCCDGALFTLVY